MLLMGGASHKNVIEINKDKWESVQDTVNET